MYFSHLKTIQAFIYRKDPEPSKNIVFGLKYWWIIEEIIIYVKPTIVLSRLLTDYGGFRHHPVGFCTACFHIKAVDVSLLMILT
jgi:hypothetical protein